MPEYEPTYLPRGLKKYNELPDMGFMLLHNTPKRWCGKHKDRDRCWKGKLDATKAGGGE